MKRKEWLGLMLALMMLAAAWFAVGNVLSSSSQEETTLVHDAVKNAAITCYAVEGAYPASLDYLLDHYGLAYDTDRYIVVYDAFASNLLPEIEVLEIGGGQS